MKNFTKFTIVIIMVGFVSACGMADKQEVIFKDVYKECADSVKNLDVYEKDGSHFSKTSDGKKFERRICFARARLYAEGYRIGKTSQESDLKIYELSLMSGRSIKSMYEELIKSGIEP